MLKPVNCYQDDLTQPISSWDRHAQVWDASDELASATLRTAAAQLMAASRLRVTIEAQHFVPSEPIQEAIRQASALARLPDGWNAYNAKPVSLAAVRNAISFLLQSASANPNLAAPTAVPTVRGGLQLEWHQNGIDFEAEFSPNNAASWYAEDRESGEMIEEAVAGHEDSIQHWLERVSD